MWEWCRRRSQHALISTKATLVAVESGLHRRGESPPPERGHVMDQLPRPQRLPATETTPFPTGQGVRSKSVVKNPDPHTIKARRPIHEDGVGVLFWLLWGRIEK